jgi:D-aminopeptidase
VALWLRSRRATREVPLVFAGGDAPFVEKVRELLPDAAYVAREQVVKAVRAAVVPAVLVVPVQLLVMDATRAISRAPFDSEM